MAVCFYESFIGGYELEEKEGALVSLRLRAVRGETEDLQETPLLREAHAQLEAYFSKRLTRFDLPYQPSGTAFQLKIWQLLCRIPYGETRTYGQVAAWAGNPKASRAVGMANHRNPLPVFIPCHRVIGGNGKLVGYGGGLEIKQKLLLLEKGTLF